MSIDWSNNIKICALESDLAEIAEAIKKMNEEGDVSFYSNELEGLCAYGTDRIDTSTESRNGVDDGCFCKISELFKNAIIHCQITSDYGGLEDCWYCNGDEEHDEYDECFDDDDEYDDDDEHDDDDSDDDGDNYDDFENEGWEYGGVSSSDVKEIKSRKQEIILEYLKDMDETIKEDTQRFLKATSMSSYGEQHKIELLPGGIVASDGDNYFGQCDILSWKDIQSISCGNWHTAGLQKDGKVVTCGSNANGQCNTEEFLNEKIIDISCGRYFTAALSESGKVFVAGTINKEKYEYREDYSYIKNITDKDFPFYYTVNGEGLDKDGLKRLNEKIETLNQGDEIRLEKRENEDGAILLDLYNVHDEKIYTLKTSVSVESMRYFKNVKAEVLSLCKLSEKKEKAKCGEFMLSLYYEYAQENGSDNICYVKDFEDWPPVVCIKAVYDAIVGITESGDIYINGYYDCSLQEIKNCILNKYNALKNNWTEAGEDQPVSKDENNTEQKKFKLKK